MLHLVKKGFEQGFDHVDLKGHEFKSIYKGRKYDMYSRPVEAKIENYLVGVTDESLLKTDKSAETQLKTNLSEESLLKVDEPKA